MLAEFFLTFINLRHVVDRSIGLDRESSHFFISLMEEHDSVMRISY
jgi:hypothetical protein